MSLSVGTKIVLATIVAGVAFVLFQELALAHYTGSGHWHWAYEIPWTNEQCYRWYNWWGQATSTIRCW